MRELQTRDETLKKEKRNKTILGIVMVALMLLSTAGYALLNYQSTDNSGSSSNNNPNGQVVEYNGVKFIGQENGLWAFNVSGNLFYSSYTPIDVKNISVPFITLQDLSSQTVYYSGNILAVSEIIGNINPFITRAQEACYKEPLANTTSTNETCIPELPIKDCSSNFIIIKEVETMSPKITIKNKCITIESNDSELLKSADALLFKMLGIK